MKEVNLAKLKKIQQEARQRILDRGKIEFRAEPELMSLVLDLAKARMVPVGPMVRQWVAERAAQEAQLPAVPRSQLDVIESKIDELLSQQHD